MFQLEDYLDKIILLYKFLNFLETIQRPPKYFTSRTCNKYEKNNHMIIKNILTFE